jgi:16S rRNA C1402 (ribose-2'-O) methylase RsmI
MLIQEITKLHEKISRGYVVSIYEEIREKLMGEFIVLVGKEVLFYE